MMHMIYLISKGKRKKTGGLENPTNGEYQQSVGELIIIPRCVDEQSVMPLT